MRRRSKAFFFLCGAAVLTCRVCVGQDFTAINSRFKSSGTPLRRICVLPAEASLTMTSMKGGEPMTKESEEWSAKVDRTMVDVLSAAGATVVSDYSSGALSDAVRQAMVEIQQKYRGVSAQMRKNLGEIRDGMATLGDEIALLPCAARADAVTFVDATGSLETKSRKTVGFVSGGIMGFGGMRSDLWIALADAMSGDIDALGHVELVGSEKFATDPGAAYGKALLRQLTKMHVGSVAKK